MAKAQGLTSGGLTSSTGLMSYPTISQAADATGVVVAILRGDTSVPKVEAVHAGWVLAGYAASRIDQHSAAVTAAPDLPPEPAAQKAALADHLDNLKANGIHAAGVVPWDQVFALLLALVQEWLHK